MSAAPALMPAVLIGLLTCAALSLWWLPPTGRVTARVLDPAALGSGPAVEPDDAPVSAGVLVELVAAMLEAGVPVSRALTVLAEAVRGDSGQALRSAGAALSLGLPWRQAWESIPAVPPPVADLRTALTFSAVSGAPSASALRAASAQVRRAEHRRAEAAAERLSVHLMVPLGLCSLPAFVCWGIVPVLVGLVPDLLG